MHTHRHFVPRKLGSSLEEIANSGRSKARQEPLCAFRRDDLSTGSHERVSLEIRVDLDTRLDHVDGWLLVGEEGTR